jgi:hypothetical protein
MLALLSLIFSAESTLFGVFTSSPRMSQNPSTEACRRFHHPFQPYDIQLQFMDALYDCIEHKQVGIFESPTGTEYTCLPYRNGTPWADHTQER